MSASKIAILYGSETGNAQDFATILSHKLQRLHFANTLSPLGDFDPAAILKARYVFILVSTTGQGDLPRNVLESSSTNKSTKKILWNILKKKNLPSDFLNHLNVAFFGLGDSSYPQFNYGIRKLQTRIVSQLGANEIFDRLEADEQGMAGSNKGTGAGVEAVYFEYEKKVIKYLMEKYPTMKGEKGNRVERVGIDTSIYLEPKSYVKLRDSDSAEYYTSNKVREVKFSGDDSIKYGKIVKNKRITADDHFQDVREFVFTNTDDSQEDEYYSGDTAAIYPCNSDKEVELFLENQNQWLPYADKPLEFTNGIPDSLKNISGGIVEPLTLRNLLKYHIDIMSIPRSSFFMKIWTFATDVARMDRGEEQVNDQRDKLKEFAYDEDMQELYDYCNRPRRSVIEILDDFLSVRLPWQYCLDYLPIIKPRLYSISSGPCNPNIELTVAIVKYRTILRNVRKGVCTTYMSKLESNDKLRYKIQKNNVIKENLRGKPMLLVSPGVGIAPLMSVMRCSPAISKNIHLFFGCRFKDKDYLYEDILEKWDEEGKIKLHPVFSRDRENSPDTKYVQDVLWKLGDELTSLLVNDAAVFFLCGASGRMPIQVRLTVMEMLKKWGGFADENSAKEFLKKMEKDGRYIQETW